MLTKTLTLKLFAGVAIAASLATAVNGASALNIAVNKTLPAPKGYHLDGFKGWDHGYPVGYRGCAPALIVIPGSCGPTLPLKQAI